MERACGCHPRFVVSPYRGNQKPTNHGGLCWNQPVQRWNLVVGGIVGSAKGPHGGVASAQGTAVLWVGECSFDVVCLGFYPPPFYFPSSLPLLFSSLADCRTPLKSRKASGPGAPNRLPRREQVSTRRPPWIRRERFCCARTPRPPPLPHPPGGGRPGRWCSHMPGARSSWHRSTRRS